MLNQLIDNDIEDKEILDEVKMKGPHENDTTVIKLQPINNKPTKKINIQENEQKKYDIVASIKKKSHINNEKV